MRRKRLNRWVAGGLAGCPGTVDVSTTDDPPTLTPAPRVGVMRAANDLTDQLPRRNGWVTAAAVVLLVEGGLGIMYVPTLVGGDLGSLQSVGILIVGLAVLNIVSGSGLLRLHGWARLAAGALAAVSLVFLYAPALVVAVANGAWLSFDWLGIVGFLVVLFAVVRRWPADQKR
jgi:hypothetical protein